METENKKNKMKPTINTKTLTVSLPIGFHMGLEEWIDSQTQHRDEAIYALLAHGLHAVRTIPKTLLKKKKDYEGRRSGRSSDTDDDPNDISEATHIQASAYRGTRYAAFFDKDIGSMRVVSR